MASVSSVGVSPEKDSECMKPLAPLTKHFVDCVFSVSIDVASACISSTFSPSTQTSTPCRVRINSAANPADRGPPLGLREGKLEAERQPDCCQHCDVQIAVSTCPRDRSQRIIHVIEHVVADRDVNRPIGQAD